LLAVGRDGTLSGTPENGDAGAFVEAQLSITVHPLTIVSVILTVIPETDELIERTETVVLTMAEGPYESGAYPFVAVFIRNSNHAPFFLADPVLAPAALVGEPYTGESLADHAGDPNLDDGDTLSFEKTSGPDWLSIAPDGTLSGLPGELDFGTNLFGVHVTDAGGLMADGTLQITVPSPFESWQLADFGPQSVDPLVVGELADPDQDGLSNVMEYALGTDPNLSGAARIHREMVDIAGTDYMRVTYFINPSATDITLVVEGTEDLADPNGWSDQNLLIEEVTTARIVVCDTLGGTRRFMRLEISR